MSSSVAFGSSSFALEPSGTSKSSEADIEWAAYYKDPNVTTKPTSQAPDWVPKDANGDPVGKTDTDLAQAYKDSLPAKGSAEYEQLSSAEKA